MKVYTCFPGGKAKALTMSYDDGKVQDRRLIDIFNKYGIKGTFNLNYGQVGERPRMTFEEMEGLYAGHEIATHTMTHPTIERCPLVEVAEELLEDRKGLEKWHRTLEGTTMKYEGYKIGPVIRDIRKDKGLLIEEVAAKTGISVSTLGQVEQGGRNLSMKNLYMLMEVYETDANSLLAIDCTPDSLDSRLKRLPADKQDYLKKTFDFMIEQALKSA